ncbi:uncharacterized protein KY384_004225 [Bacidia gigantensis]|uniref:uncharacterized protein n=1 Tax=Bacidia gigantensis TaxID=2732470 RepID=UPI001D04DF7B|nr:uncharacterized protein KY384_004225 [Bacidia gigantensis]KAG8530868.1 hypothetical protein KY384_004225 [Bacidia gigantensis]
MGKCIKSYGPPLRAQTSNAQRPVKSSKKTHEPFENLNGEESKENAPPKLPISSMYPAPEEKQDDEYDSDSPVTEDCDAIRRKIKAFLNSGEMKVTEFQRACHINSSSYQRFIKLKGPSSGDANQTYSAAFHFFERRKAGGKKEVPSRKRLSNFDDPKVQPKKKKTMEPINRSLLLLDGEEDGEVEIYDTCDEIRRKIAAHLRDPTNVQAQFLREIAACLPDPDMKVQSSSLNTFQKKKGPLAGNESRVYYAAYCYFEKKRIAEGKSKTQMRLEMEDAWPSGVDRKRQGGFIVTAGTSLYTDKYGRARCHVR